MKFQTKTKAGHFPTWAMATFGGSSVIIGIFLSAVATWFFALGLLATEPDERSRDALFAAGVLLTACQLIAFSSTELLPEGVLTRQRWRPKVLACVLFCFEVLTMAITQQFLVETADVQASAIETRATELRAQLDSLRRSAAGLRENGEIQSRSKFPESRAEGAAALRQAVDVERDIGRLADELTKVESSRKPTFTSLLGPDRTTWFIVLRSALVALAGLVMVSWGSSLIGEARRAGHIAARAGQPPAGGPPAVAVEQPPACEPAPASSARPSAVTVALPAPNLSVMSKWTPRIAALETHHPISVSPASGCVTSRMAPAPVRHGEHQSEERAAAAVAAASAIDNRSQSMPAVDVASSSAVTAPSAWQARRLAQQYPVVFFDGHQVKVYGAGGVRSRYAYVALGAQSATGLEPLGIWMEHTVGATFWLTVFKELKARGVESILLAVADDFAGLSAALRDVFPAATPQTCIAHLVRDSLDYATPKDRKALAGALRPIYKASCADVAAAELEDFERKAIGQKYPDVVALWRLAWERVTPFLAFPPDVRRLVYTTNAIEEVHEQVARLIKAQGHVSGDAAAIQLIFGALDDTAARSTKDG